METRVPDSVTRGPQWRRASLDENVFEPKVPLELDRCGHTRQTGAHHDAVAIRAESARSVSLLFGPRIEVGTPKTYAV